ncbi:MAG TPA: response regulator transcription factor [Bryobacteraceae bacterium]|nr:response regulator transcription factor [Bryobacteraceae bacterium]
MKPIRVLCVDDHPVVRRGVAAMLGTEPELELVAEAASGKEAVDLFRQLRPDVVLMDLRLAGEMDGIEAIHVICSESPQARILVLTTYAGDENIHRALHAGARGYLIKDTLDDRLLDAIRALYEGRRYVPPEVAVQLAEHGPRVELTEREREVLELIARGLRNKEISAALLISEATARTHVENIVAKLGVNSRTEALVVAAQRGFIRL